MNKDELFKKVLKEFDEWPYVSPAMIYCHTGYGRFKTGCFSDYEYDGFSFLNTDNWQEVCTKQEFEEAKAKMKLEEKHYWNGKEELEVGMWVQTSAGQHEILLPFDGGEFTAIPDNNGRYLIAHKDAFKPIDTRTDKEKAVYEVLSDAPAFIRADKLDIKVMLEKAYDEWVENKKNEF